MGMTGSTMVWASFTAKFKNFVQHLRKYSSLFLELKSLIVTSRYPVHQNFDNLAFSLIKIGNNCNLSDQNTIRIFACLFAKARHFTIVMTYYTT